jgi:hypothetical protein
MDMSTSARPPGDLPPLRPNSPRPPLCAPVREVRQRREPGCPFKMAPGKRDQDTVRQNPLAGGAAQERAAMPHLRGDAPLSPDEHLRRRGAEASTQARQRAVGSCLHPGTRPGSARAVPQGAGKACGDFAALQAAARPPSPPRPDRVRGVRQWLPFIPPLHGEEPRERRSQARP